MIVRMRLLLTLRKCLHLNCKVRSMKASLTLNYDNQIALFYDEALGFSPEWASIDLELGAIFLGGSDVDNKAITLDKIDQNIYERIKHNTDILLVHLKDGNKDDIVGTLFVPLMLSAQL